VERAAPTHELQTVAIERTFRNRGASRRFGNFVARTRRIQARLAQYLTNNKLSFP
jgi:hypothetical protein